MRGLKALVIGMGVVIVAGVVFLIFAIVEKAGEGGPDDPSRPGGPGGKSVAAGNVPAAGNSVNNATPQTVTLPAGAEVVETRTGDGIIVLRLRLADGGGRLLMFDARTGKPTGRINLRSQ